MRERKGSDEEERRRDGRNRRDKREEQRKGKHEWRKRKGGIGRSEWGREENEEEEGKRGECHDLTLIMQVPAPISERGGGEGKGMGVYRWWSSKK